MSEIKRFKLKTQNAKNRKISELRISVNEATTLYKEIDKLQTSTQQLTDELNDVKEQLKIAQKHINENTHVKETTEINIIGKTFKI